MARPRRADSFLLAALFLCALRPAPCALALEIPPKPTAWVTDNANILAPQEEQALNEKLQSLKQKNGAEFLIMTFPSLEGEEVVDYTNRVANQWKVEGDRTLMLFVFLNDRKTWIQVGYGLEGDIPDAIASRVYRNTLVPAFRNGDYYGGIDQAVNELIQRIDPSFVPTTTAPRRPAAPVEEQAETTLADLIFPFVLLLLIVFFIVPMMRRTGGCGGCIGPLFWLGSGLGRGGGITFGGGGSSSGGGFDIGGSWGGGGSSFGGGGAGGGW